MQTADIVLISYDEIIKSYPKISPPEDLKTFEKIKLVKRNLGHEIYSVDICCLSCSHRQAPSGRYRNANPQVYPVYTLAI